MSDAPNGNATQIAEVRRTISPYDFTAADNLGAVISHPLLRGTNYDEWACGMKTALSSRKKFGFLDGTITRPADGSSDFEDWITIQALLVSWIRMTIDPNLHSTISHREVAKDMWDYLKKRFSVTNGQRTQQLMAELTNCKQKGLSIEAYYGKMNRIWDGLANHRPLRVCKCGKCDYNLNILQEQDGEEDKVHEFLFGLDDSFWTVRSSLVSRTPIPSLEEVYNVIKQEEDLKSNEKKLEEVPEVTAFAVQQRQQSQGTRFEDKDKFVMCRHCNHPGHASENCFAIIGYPEWWGERSKGRVIQPKGTHTGSSFGTGRGRGNITYANTVQVSTPPNTIQANWF